MLFLKGVIPFYFLIDCTTNDEKITLQWKDGKATGIFVPQHYLDKTSVDSISTLLTVHLDTPAEDNPAILGEFIFNNNEIIFQPLVAFTSGLKYEVRFRKRTLEHIEIPLPDSKNAPRVSGVYPSQDTLPHNVLKFYIRFSRPMSEGRALEHIVLLKNGRDTIHDAFLDLNPELWDRDKSMLTLWLDPGRIKRDLQPNKLLGEPLQMGAHYELVIDRQWKDVNGSTLAGSFSKKFTVTKRDSLSPDVEQWTIRSPQAGSTEPLVVSFHEPLDYSLLHEAVWVKDEKESHVAGTIEVDQEESVIKFTPQTKWIEGPYAIQCESRLEDLAGNNLNRPFDRDVTKNSASGTKKTYSRKFIVE